MQLVSATEKLRFYFILTSLSLHLITEIVQSISPLSKTVLFW